MQDQFAQEVGVIDHALKIGDLRFDVAHYLRGIVVFGQPIFLRLTVSRAPWLWLGFACALTVCRDRRTVLGPLFFCGRAGVVRPCQRHDPLGVSPAAVLKVRRVPGPPLHSFASLARLDADFKLDKLLSGRNAELIGLLAVLFDLVERDFDPLDDLR